MQLKLGRIFVYCRFPFLRSRSALTKCGPCSAVTGLADTSDASLQVATGLETIQWHQIPVSLGTVFQSHVRAGSSCVVRGGSMTEVTYQTIKKLGHGAFGEVGFSMSMQARSQQCYTLVAA
jgi:hypothetical protein